MFVVFQKTKIVESTILRKHEILEAFKTKAHQFCRSDSKMKIIKKQKIVHARFLLNVLFGRFGFLPAIMAAPASFIGLATDEVYVGGGSYDVREKVMRQLRRAGEMFVGQDTFPCRLAVDCNDGGTGPQQYACLNFEPACPIQGHDLTPHGQIAAGIHASLVHVQAAAGVFFPNCWPELLVPGLAPFCKIPC